MAVTGASGFIGRRLVAALRSLGVDPLTERADVTEPRALQAWAHARPALVFHLAVARDGERAAAVNIEGTRHVLAAAGSARVVHLGGALERDPGSTYGATKAEGTRRALEAGAVVVRPSFVYGPGQPPSKFIPAVLRAARDGDTVPVLAAAPVDWVYVDDVVDACLAAARPEVPAGVAVDVGSGELHAPADVVAVAERVTGRAIAQRPSDDPPRPWDRARAAVDTTLLRDLFGVSPRPLAAGLQATWDAPA